MGANRLTVDPKRVVNLKALLEKLLTGSRRNHVKDLARVTGLLQSMNHAVGQAIRIIHSLQEQKKRLAAILYNCAA